MAEVIPVQGNDGFLGGGLGVSGRSECLPHQCPETCHNYCWLIDMEAPDVAIYFRG